MRCRTYAPRAVGGPAFARAIHAALGQIAANAPAQGDDALGAATCLRQWPGEVCHAMRSTGGTMWTFTGDGAGRQLVDVRSWRNPPPAPPAPDLESAPAVDAPRE
jgi:hypothetical protein